MGYIRLHKFQRGIAATKAGDKLNVGDESGAISVSMGDKVGKI